IYHYDGSNWTRVPGPLVGYSQRLYDVHAFAPNDVWALGGYQDASGYHVLALHYDGAVWTRFECPSGGSALVAFAPDDVFSIGGGVAHWDGASWTQQPYVQGVNAPSTLAASIAGPCQFWAVGRQQIGSGLLTLTAQVQPAPQDQDQDFDGVPDGSDNCPTIFNPDQADCDADGMGDTCAIASGADADCNGNAIPDGCESFADCNANNVPDECETDCNDNGIPDACDVAAGTSNDCNGNGVPDECESMIDCNQNGIGDECDIASGVSADSNDNGVPDECEPIGPHVIAVTTYADVVDFGGAQQQQNLPGPDGRVSFREAVTAANNTPGPQTITFYIPRAEWWLFTDRALLEQASGIFLITDDQTTLDFTTQTAYTGDTNPLGGEVSIFGVEPNAWGVTSILIQANDCLVRGLGTVHQRGHGVQIMGNHNRVIGSHIEGPLYSGVYISGGFGGPTPTGNIIGGTQPEEANVLIGGNDGVRIDEPADANVVIGNALLSGAFSGVAIRGATNTRIGGPTPAERNLISGAGHFGEEGFPVGVQVSVEFDAANTLIEGNYIGTTADGSAAYPGQRGPGGVGVSDATNTVIRGNLISGIRVVGTNHYAGQTFGTGITVTGTAADTLIVGNRIGTDSMGEIAVPNFRGVYVIPFTAMIIPQGATVGRDSPGEGNEIAFNIREGVAVHSLVDRVSISGNSIHDNGTLGIDLGLNGPTPNDAGDADGGANDLQNYPTLTAAVGGGSIRIQGVLQSLPSRSYTIEFFAGPACSPSGFGEGRTFLGSTQVNTDESGNAPFDVTLASAVDAGTSVTATATSDDFNTSEFSACLIVEATSLAADLNCDGAVNNFDIDPFVMALSDPSAYAAAYPNCSASRADVNGDGHVNNFDIDPFVACVANGGCQ
ncbi:MAG: hypothetical protein JNG88_18015, partial [Phycisphaerales bacterium]|nr:hypothetical protein [Phycisphaerales bacterium]